MTVTLTHNIDKIINRLTTFERTDVPRAARSTMHQLGNDLANVAFPQYMKALFRDPVSFTLKSARYKVTSAYSVDIFFRQDVGKGNDPARYLYPVARDSAGESSKPAYATKFTRYLRKAGIVPKDYYPIRLSNVSKRIYSSTWSGLGKTTGAGKTGAGFRYFSIPDLRNRRNIKSRQGSFFDLKEGIYRVKGRDTKSLQMLFAYSRKTPEVPTIFDYVGFVEKNIKFKIGPMLAQNLR